MSEPSREEIAARFDGLRSLIEQRFDTVDEHFARLNGRVGKTEDRVGALEKDSVKIKAYWSSGLFVLTLVGGWLRSKVGL